MHSQSELWTTKAACVFERFSVVAHVRSNGKFMKKDDENN